MGQSRLISVVNLRQHSETTSALFEHGFPSALQGGHNDGQIVQWNFGRKSDEKIEQCHFGSLPRDFVHNYLEG